MGLLKTALLFLGCALLSTTASAKMPIPTSTPIVLGDETSIPAGWIDFCARYEGECPASDTALMVVLNPDVWQLLNRINTIVNEKVAPIEDIDHWGVVDRWDYPLDGRGDCEDYVLLKRKLLIEAKFPASAVLPTVVASVRVVDGKLVSEHHAVLTLITSTGDYILDNLDPDVRPWTWTGYGFVKRLSPLDPAVWLDIIQPMPAAVASIKK